MSEKPKKDPNTERLARLLKSLNYTVESMNRNIIRVETAIEKTRDSKIPDIPPRWVLVAARTRLNQTRHWQDYYSVLCQFYEIPSIATNVNPEAVGDKAIAHFIKNPEPKIESRENTMSDHTALHEFFHYLMFKKRGYNNGEAEQVLCNAFADACLARERSCSKAVYTIQMQSRS